MNTDKRGRCLVHWGGWEGHHPERWKDILSSWLCDWGFAVDTSHDLDIFRDPSRLSAYGLIVPLWTLGELTAEQESGLAESVAGGVGLGGFHGMCGAFCGSATYKRMTGGQLVAHPGGVDMTYRVQIRDHDHPITRGLGNFTMHQTEQYYMHVDTTVHVLATTAFEDGAVSPVAWTYQFGRGRVFYISNGHFPSDYNTAEPAEMLKRFLQWALS